MSEEDFKNVIEQYFTAINDMNLEAWVNTFAPDCYHQDPANGAVLTGHAAIKVFFQNIGMLLAEAHFSTTDIFVCGNSAAVKWLAQVKGKNGRELHIAGIDIFEFNDYGKIQKLLGYWNPAAMIAALQS